MSALVECVPNISEGQRPAVIKDIVRRARQAGARVLHVDTGYSTNRTVITMAGTPEVMAEAAFQLIRGARDSIDMRSHVGTHPRLGATDVCPFVPLEGVTLEECSRLACSVGARVGDELGIPVFLYEEAASSPNRKALPHLRRGQFEGLSHRMKTEPFLPDYGPHEPHLTAGAVIIGARPILVAFNVDLDTRDVAIAQAIAGRLRESGDFPRVFDQGRVRPIGNIRVPGKFKKLRAIGWYIPEYGCAQVSFNILDYTVCSVAEVMRATHTLAQEFNTTTTGSELIGLMPSAALRDDPLDGEPSLRSLLRLRKAPLLEDFHCSVELQRWDRDVN